MSNEDSSTTNLETLAHECRKQTESFKKLKKSDPRYCFELLIQAFRDEDEIALTYVYKVYQPILVGRAYKHPAFSDSCRDANLLASTALSHYYHAVRKEKFLQKFQELPQALAYMYRCLHTTILIDVRNNAMLEEFDSEQHRMPFQHDSEPAYLLQLIDELLSSDDDRLLVRLRYVYEMKPAEIAESYPEKWADARTVSVTLQRIRRRLSTSTKLSNLLNSSPNQNNK